MLEELRITLDGVGHALHDSSLAVPLYQRSYAWEERHVSDLLNDVADALSGPDTEYFLGSIVIIRQEGQRDQLVDGQQRLATLTILLAAMRDYLDSVDDTEGADDLENRFLTRRNRRTKERVPHLELNESDDPFFQRTVLLPPNERNLQLAANKDSHKRIREAARIAQERVRTITDEGRRSGRSH